MRKRLRTAGDIEGELKVIEKSLERLHQSFGLEKDYCLEQGKLGQLRDREKCHYQPRIRSLETELKQLRYLSGRVDGVSGSIFQRMKELEKCLKEARAHFTGTVNRLIRCAGSEPGESECIE